MAEKKGGFFRRMMKGLWKNEIDEDFYEELEEIMIMGDMGVATTEAVLDDLRGKVAKHNIKYAEDCRFYLIETMKDQLRLQEEEYDFTDKKSVVLVVGVNGVGKTTSVGKLAAYLKKYGKKVVLAAADTFRAAATEQLQMWAERAGVDIIAAQEGADPGSVLFDAIAATKSRNADLLLVDTAGRLHNKKNLMNELGKLYRIIEREYPEAHKETLVVLDATTGQNALAQAREFNEVANLTGIILTKLDSSAKGGVAIAVQSELGIPIKYVGTGEKLEDFRRFDPDAYIDELFAKED
ncbi:MAG: signal recognition particle-docking protein FtsY [Eubacterium sp.]|nr:signal recognition particle-docking protein FtsY [Eubacterium sp.]